MTEPRKPNLAQNPSEVFNQVIEQRRTPGAGVPAEDPQAATKPHPVALALARLRSHGYHDEAKELERFTSEQHDAIYAHHRKGPPPVLDLNELSEEERLNLLEQLSRGMPKAAEVHSSFIPLATFHSALAAMREEFDLTHEPCDDPLLAFRAMLIQANTPRKRHKIDMENSALRKTLLNIAGMVNAPERLDEISDAEVIGKAVQTTVFAHNDSISYANQLEDQIKHLKDTRRSDYEEIRLHIERAGGGRPESVWPALEELITNLLANQKPEGFENHMKVITDTLATYEAAFAIIENATGLAKSAKAR